jgi:hypothetical protein
MAVPLAKLDVQVVAQLPPEGVLTTLPLPPAAKSMVSAAEPPEPEPVKHATLACIVEVTIAPDDD